MKSPDYTVRDLVFYIGMFGGIIGTVQFMQRSFQTPHIVNLLCGGIVGYVLGRTLLSACNSARRPGNDTFDPEDRD